METINNKEIIPNAKIVKVYRRKSDLIRLSYDKQTQKYTEEKKIGDFWKIVRVYLRH